MIIWVLFTDDGTDAVMTVYRSEQAALASLRENFTEQRLIRDEDLVDYVRNQGVTVHIGADYLDPA